MHGALFGRNWLSGSGEGNKNVKCLQTDGQTCRWTDKRVTAKGIQISKSFRHCILGFHPGYINFLFNFQPSLFRLLQTFEKKYAVSCVSQTSILPNFFNLERVCRQGDPISPYIYIYLLCVEKLAIYIKFYSNIKGI